MAEHVCPWYVAYTFDNPLRSLVHKPEKMLGDYLEPGFSAADVGCGMGHFSLGMARLVGPTGRVLALDLQDKMLARVRRRARSSGLESIIESRLCTQSDLGLTEPVDFIMTFWMVHEVPDREGFFDQLRSAMKPTARCLMAEPKFHVSHEDFQGSLALAESRRLKIVEQPRVALSHAALLASE